MGASGSKKRGPGDVFKQFDRDQDGFLSPTELTSFISKASNSKKIAADLGVSQDRLSRVLQVFQRVKDPPGISSYQFSFFFQQRLFKVGLFGPHACGKTTIIEEFAGPEKVPDEIGENMVSSRVVEIGNRIELNFQISQSIGDKGIGPGSFGCGRRSDAWQGLDAVVVVYSTCKPKGFYETTATIMKDTISYTEPGVVKVLLGTHLDRKTSLSPYKLVPPRDVKELVREYETKHPKEIQTLHCFENGKMMGDSAEKIFISLAALWLTRSLEQMVQTAKEDKDPSGPIWSSLVPFSWKEIVYLSLFNSSHMEYLLVWGMTALPLVSAFSDFPQEIRIRIFRLFLDVGRGAIDISIVERI